MRRIWLGLRSLSWSLPLVAALSCSAGGSTSTFRSDAGAGGSGGLGFDAATSLCGSCQAGAYVACDSEGQPTSTTPCSNHAATRARCAAAGLRRLPVTAGTA